jgi:hypothetical protein
MSSTITQNTPTCSGAASGLTQAITKHSSPAGRMPSVLVAGDRLALNSEVGRALIEDIARYTEGLLDDEGLCGTWGISPGELTALKNHQDVFEAVRATKRRREQDGSAAREAGRKAFLKAPRVLEQILDDPYSPTRAKIEASRELRAVAGFSPEQAADVSQSFHVTINLGAGDIKHFEFTGRSGEDRMVDVSPHPIAEKIGVPRSNEDEE